MRREGEGQSFTEFNYLKIQALERNGDLKASILDQMGSYSI